MMKINKNSGFTLIEILIGMMIFSIILIGSFQVLSQLGIARTKLMTETSIEKKAIYFSQKLFEEIKQGGIIDYEEYFNRKVFNNNSPEYLSGHYKNPSGFGNYGEDGDIGASNYGTGFYYCHSDGTNKMLIKQNGKYVNNGCFSTGDLNTSGNNQLGKFQRYGEYVLQFIDFKDDVDGDGKIIGDNDDVWLGKGPEVFQLNEAMPELYLISGDKKHRTYFRYNIKIDPNAPSSKKDCSSLDNGKTYSGSGCLGTIEILKLDGKDWGMDHDTTSSGAFDGKIDTWIINKKFSGKISTLSSNSIIAGENTYWQPLFDDSINVKNVEFYLYPNKDTSLAWKEDNNDFTAPYIKLKMTLTPSWKTKRQIKGKIPEININTIISLSDVLSN